MSKSINQRGYRTVCINRKNDVDIEESINRLEQDERNSGLDYIFTVDMFNEGIDIPEVNQIVMLWPTQSNIVFVQQLGRGLKDFKKSSLRIELFVNKSDDEGSEFYYLGQLEPLKLNQTTTIHKKINKTIVNIIYKLDQPVRDDIYDYITN